MTDAISALLEVLAAHEFRFDYGLRADDLELLQRILPDVTEKDFETCATEDGMRTIGFLRPQAIERARKALEKPGYGQPSPLLPLNFGERMPDV